MSQPLQPTSRQRQVDSRKAKAANLAIAKQKSLELLFDYTKFHIGVYLTLTASYMAAAVANVQGDRLLYLNPWFVVPAVLAFVVAGLAGGVIASSLTQQVGGSSEDFLAKSIGPWEWKWKGVFRPARQWTWVEHTAFWIGLALAIASFIPVTDDQPKRRVVAAAASQSASGASAAARVAP